MSITDKTVGKYTISGTPVAGRADLFVLGGDNPHHIGTIVSGSKSKLSRFEDDCHRIVCALAAMDERDALKTENEALAADNERLRYQRDKARTKEDAANRRNEALAAARAEGFKAGIEAAARAGAVACYKTHHVTLGDAVAAAIRQLGEGKK